ncbi:MAG: Asp-tRNA(Asn)/Glu-tRNA(Gln) amidotransferase subunit GatC [bacterium]|nr:Asp-tRNA(Asn)/Glu-tRNA(Gln) amidotransferase subunit GatC [bacterium]
MTKDKLTQEEVKHVAKLAKLTLTDEEVGKFQQQLSNVLEYVEVLGKVNTDEVEPTSQVTGIQNAVREDKSAPSLTQGEALSGAKNKEKGMFKVKAIFK